MPRRRMLDPSFTDDIHVAKLTRDERLLLIGCVRNGDDDGRLRAHPAYLKAEIFMYDDDIDLERMKELKQSTLEKMKTWPKGNIWRMIPYENSGEDYLYFPNWDAQQKPSHPTPSKLPPPPEIPEKAPQSSSKCQEEVPKDSRVTPSQSSIGQSSQVKYSIGQVSAVQEDFTKFLDSESDLIDFLTSTLTKYLPRGPTWLATVLKKLWFQAMGEEMKHPVFDLTLQAVKQYPPVVLARAYVKAIKYHGGKTGSWKYLDKILKEQAGKGKPP